MQREVHASFTKWEGKHHKRITILEGERARLFAIVCSDSEDYPRSLAWWLFSLKSYIECESEMGIRTVVDSILELITIKLKDHKPVQIFNEMQMHYRFEEILDTVETIPELLSKEKKIIKKFIDKVFAFLPVGSSKKAMEGSNEKTEE